MQSVYVRCSERNVHVLQVTMEMYFSKLLPPKTNTNFFFLSILYTLSKLNHSS